MKTSVKISLTTLVGMIIGALIVILYVQTCSDTKVAEDRSINLVNALNDSITYYKGKDGTNKARIKVLETTTAKTFLSLQTKDVEVQQLQQIVKEYKGDLRAGNSITLALLKTVDSGTQATFVSRVDTVYIEPIESMGGYGEQHYWPTYTDSVTNKWLIYKAEMNKDSAKHSIEVFNEFSAVIGKDKKGSFADITTYNPYTTVKTLRTYQVSQPPPKRFGIGFSTGATYDGSLKPYLGIGINYNVIRF